MIYLLQRGRRGTLFYFSFVVLMLNLALPVTSGWAMLISSVPKPDVWDPLINQILLEGTDPMAQSLPSVLPDYAPGVDYSSVEDTYQNNSIYHTGNGVGEHQIVQHVFAYTIPDGTPFFTVKNLAGNERTFNVTADELGIKTKRSRVTLQSDVILDGSLLFVKEQEDGFDDLFATFEILLTRENGRKIFKGSVSLKPDKKGNVKIRTTGKIKKKYISNITDEDGIFRIDFEDVRIPYRTRVKLGEEYSITTQVFSEASNRGLGTGAEVIFGPGSPKLPDYQERGIPEPATFVLLSIGATMVFFRTGRFSRQRKQI